VALTVPLLLQHAAAEPLSWAATWEAAGGLEMRSGALACCPAASMQAADPKVSHCLAPLCVCSTDLNLSCCIASFPLLFAAPTCLTTCRSQRSLRTRCVQLGVHCGGLGMLVALYLCSATQLQLTAAADGSMAGTAGCSLRCPGPQPPAHSPGSGEQADGEDGPPDLGQPVGPRHRSEWTGNWQTGGRPRAGCPGGGAWFAVACDDGHQPDLYFSLP